MFIIDLDVQDLSKYFRSTFWQISIVLELYHELYVAFNLGVGPIKGPRAQNKGHHDTILEIFSS